MSSHTWATMPGVGIDLGEKRYWQRYLYISKHWIGYLKLKLILFNIIMYIIPFYFIVHKLTQNTILLTITTIILWFGIVLYWTNLLL